MFAAFCYDGKRCVFVVCPLWENKSSIVVSGRFLATQKEHLTKMVSQSQWDWELAGGEDAQRPSCPTVFLSPYLFPRVMWVPLCVYSHRTSRCDSSPMDPSLAFQGLVVALQLFAGEGKWNSPGQTYDGDKLDSDLLVTCLVLFPSVLPSPHLKYSEERNQTTYS